MTWLINPYRFGGTTLAAAYWKFIPLAWPDSTGTLIVGDIGLAATSGGANLLTGGTATAGVGTAANAFDGNLGNRWTPTAVNAAAGTAWVKYACAAPILPVEFFATAGGNSGDKGGMPTVWLIQNSADDVAYNSVMIAEFAAYASDGQKQTAALAQADFEDIEANARGWEYNMTGHPQGASGGGWLREIEFRPTYGGSASTGHADYCYVTRPYAGSGDDGKPRRLFDGNTSSLNVSVGTPYTPCRFGFIRAEPIGVMEELRINPESGDQATALTARWTVDGINWHDKKAFSSITGWSNGTFKSFDLR